jgi:hypothetical protein
MSARPKTSGRSSVPRTLTSALATMRARSFSMRSVEGARMRTS